MHTYFIRHTDRMSIEESSINALWDEHKIAIHYPQNKQHEILPNEPDNSSTDPQDYKAYSPAQRAMKYFNEVATDGGYVCAEYRNHQGCHIGKVLPQSRIILMETRWHNGKKPEGTPALLKTLALTNVQELSPINSALLLVARPRQGTLSRWHAIGSMVEKMVDRQPIQLTLDTLLPAQQEIMCAEFLRYDGVAKKVGLPQLVYLVTSVGQTMRDLDIIGISKDGQRITAQVTYRKPDDSESKSKLNRLAIYGKAPNVYLLFFCNCEEIEQNDNGIWYVPLKLVFDSFKSNPIFHKALCLDSWTQV